MAHTLLQLGLTNAALAALLAVAALLVGRWCKLPQIRYGLWMLVLLKLVTPPLHYVPMQIAASDVQSSSPADDAIASVHSDFERVTQSTETLAGAITFLNDSDELSSVNSDEIESAGLVQGTGLNNAPYLSPDFELSNARGAAQQYSGLESPTIGPSRDNSNSELAPATSFRIPKITWPSMTSVTPIVIGVWLAGSIMWLTLAVYRSVRFGRMLRHTSAAPAWLNDQADVLAERFGLARRPVVLLASGRLSPLLWAVPAKACILLPREIVRSADRSQVATLLAHELAHYRRGDHYCRWFELLVLSLFWWNPVAWWARRQLHRAEEECCDAWVVWALPEQSRVYAGAILETLDFLSGSQPVMPALASGLGTADVLERRLKMILQGSLPRQLSWRAQLSLLLAAAVVLPLSATAQDTAPSGAPGAGAPTVETTAPVASNGSAAPSAGLAPGTATNSDSAPSAGLAPSTSAGPPSADVAPGGQPTFATPPGVPAVAPPPTLTPVAVPGSPAPPTAFPAVRPVPAPRPESTPPAFYEAPDRSIEARMDRLEHAIQQLLAAQSRPGMVAGKPHKAPPVLKAYRYAPPTAAQPNSIGEIKKRRVDLEVQIDELSEQIERLKGEMEKLDKSLENATKKREGATSQRAGATLGLLSRSGDVISVTVEDEESEDESAEKEEAEDDDDEQGEDEHDNEDRPTIELRRQ